MRREEIESVGDTHSPDGVLTVETREGLLGRLLNEVVTLKISRGLLTAREKCPVTENQHICKHRRRPSTEEENEASYMYLLLLM